MKTYRTTYIFPVGDSRPSGVSHTYTLPWSPIERILDRYYNKAVIEVQHDGTMLLHEVVDTDEERVVVKPVKNCGHSEATLGTCPYQTEVRGDNRICLCCSDCRRECYMDV